MSGFFVEILTEGPNEALTPDPSTGVDIEVIVTDVSVSNEMPGAASIEIQEPVMYRQDYQISSTQPTDPAIMIWYKIT